MVDRPLRQLADLEPALGQGADPGMPGQPLDRTGPGPGLGVVGVGHHQAGGVVGRHRGGASEEAPGLTVGQHGVPDRSGRLEAVPSTGRSGAEPVSAEGLEEGLPLRDPAGHQVAEGLADPVDVAGPQQVPGSIVVEPALVVGEPAGEGPVDEAGPRAEPQLGGGGQQVAAELDGVRRVLTGLGLQLGPLQRQHDRGGAEAGQLLQILPPGTGERDRRAAPIGVGGSTGRDPAAPVGGRRATLDLGGGQHHPVFGIATPAFPTHPVSVPSTDLVGCGRSDPTTLGSW